MRLWKVVGDASVGIVTLVALPIAGPMGSITLLGAIVAGSVGVGIGAINARSNKPEKQAEARGKKQATANYALKYAKIVESLNATDKQINDTADYFQLLLALETVGLACASCDGAITTQERIEIDEFVAGIVSSALPVPIQQKIDAIADNPPTIKTAFAVASQVITTTELGSYALFSDLINIVIQIDNKTTQEERAFQQAWNELVLMKNLEEGEGSCHVQSC